VRWTRPRRLKKQRIWQSKLRPRGGGGTSRTKYTIRAPGPGRSRESETKHRLRPRVAALHREGREEVRSLRSWWSPQLSGRLAAAVMAASRLHVKMASPGRDRQSGRD